MGSDTAAPGLGLGGGLREAWDSGPGYLPSVLGLWTDLELDHAMPGHYLSGKRQLLEEPVGDP